MGDPVSIGLTVGSTLFSAMSARNAGIAADNEAKYRAQQAEIQAGQQRAASQRTMIEELRKMRLTQSKAQANAAASGGGALDPSVIDIMGDLETEGRYRANVAMYEGEDSARDLENQAVLSRYEGKEARRAGNVKALTTLASGASSLYGKYGDSFASSSSSGGAYGGGFTNTSGGRIDWYPRS